MIPINLRPWVGTGFSTSDVERSFNICPRVHIASFCAYSNSWSDANGAKIDPGLVTFKTPAGWDRAQVLERLFTARSGNFVRGGTVLEPRPQKIRARIGGLH